MEEEIRFITNKITSKAITDKQAHYLIHNVLHPIIEYRTQTTFLTPSKCEEWDRKIRNAFRRKAKLPKDMPTNAIHHPGMYNIKRIATLQAESKITSATIRLNSTGITKELFIQQIIEHQLSEWLPDSPLASPSPSTNRRNTQLVTGISQILSEQELRLTIPDYPIQPSNEEWIGKHTSQETYKKMLPYLKRKNILYCHQARGDLTPRRFLSTFWDLRLTTRTAIPEEPTGSRWINHQHTETTINIYTDGAIDTTIHGSRKKGIGIYYEETIPPIIANAPTARDSTQTELQAICLAITISPPHQSIRLHTDSSRAIHAIQKEANTAKQLVRRAYDTELRLIQKTTRQKSLQIEWIKVKAHSNNQSNNQADQLAKEGKTSNNTFKITATDPILTDSNGIPIGQDPRRWIKKKAHATTILKWQEETLTRHVSPDFIWQTDWITTAMTWEEEGHITGGTNTFLGCYTRTFKSKVLHDRLPTATRKRLYDPNYPTIKCLYCTAPETTAHVLTCARTKVDLTTILINMHSQLDHNLDPEPVSNTFFQPDPRHQAYLIRGLVPATWTSKSKAQKETRQAAAKLINTIINLFRKLIWNPWCQERKRWERRQAPSNTTQEIPANTSSYTEIDIQQRLDTIMSNNLPLPVWVDTENPPTLQYINSIQIA